MKLSERVKRLETDIPALFITLKRKETPFPAKILAAVCYALSPIDFIPDFVPVLGFLDDLLILSALAALATIMVPRTLLR